MTRDDIIRMAKEAGLYTKCEVHSAVPFDQLLTSFAALIAAAEREACAKLCERTSKVWKENDANLPPELKLPWLSAEECAAAIRARGRSEALTNLNKAAEDMGEEL